MLTYKTYNVLVYCRYVMPTAVNDSDTWGDTNMILFDAVCYTCNEKVDLMLLGNNVNNVNNPYGQVRGIGDILESERYMQDYRYSMRDIVYWRLVQRGGQFILQHSARTIISQFYKLLNQSTQSARSVHQNNPSTPSRLFASSGRDESGLHTYESTTATKSNPEDERRRLDDPIRVMVYVSSTDDKEMINLYKSLLSVLDLQSGRNVNVLSRGIRGGKYAGPSKSRHNQLQLLIDLKSDKVMSSSSSNEPLSSDKNSGGVDDALNHCTRFLLSIGIRNTRELCLGRRVGVYNLMIPSCVGDLPNSYHVDVMEHNQDTKTNSEYEKTQRRMTYKGNYMECFNRLTFQLNHVMSVAVPDILLTPIRYLRVDDEMCRYS